jgi:hypothetical protein
MIRTLPTYDFKDNPKAIGIFVDRRRVVVSVVEPTHLPAREDVT